MIVVSDTSAITSLIQIGQERALHVLFERVVIPIAVRDELLRFHTKIPDFVEVAGQSGVARLARSRRRWMTWKRLPDFESEEL